MQAIVAYVADRMAWDAPYHHSERHWFGSATGVSSNAMVRAALGGTPVVESEYPRDLGDYGRCRLAYQRAPWTLRRRMRPIMLQYRARLRQRWAEPLLK